MKVPFRPSHSFTDLSKEALTIYLPSGENCTCSHGQTSSIVSPEAWICTDAVHCKWHTFCKLRMLCNPSMSYMDQDQEDRDKVMLGSNDTAYCMNKAV